MRIRNYMLSTLIVTLALLRTYFFSNRPMCLMTELLLTNKPHESVVHTCQFACGNGLVVSGGGDMLVKVCQIFHYIELQPPPFLGEKNKFVMIKNFRQ